MGCIPKCRLCFLNDQFRSPAAEIQEVARAVLPGPQEPPLEVQSPEDRILGEGLPLVGDKEVVGLHH